MKVSRSTQAAFLRRAGAFSAALDLATAFFAAGLAAGFFAAVLATAFFAAGFLAAVARACTGLCDVLLRARGGGASPASSSSSSDGLRDLRGGGSSSSSSSSVLARAGFLPRLACSSETRSMTLDFSVCPLPPDPAS